MVELADIRRWNPGALNAVYDDVASAEQDLMQTGDDFIAAGRTVDSWTGAAAFAARQEHQGLTSALSHGVAGLRLLLKTLGELMDAVRALHRTIEEAEELARKYGYQVGENGDITDALTNPGPHDPHPDDRKAARTEVEATLKQVVRTGTDIDADLTRVLNRIGDGEVGTGGETTTTAAAAHGAAAQSLTLPNPPQNATAAQNAAWWSTLSPNAQALMLGNRPGVVGGLNGLPATTRSTANMTTLAAETTRIQGKLGSLREQLANAPKGGDYQTIGVNRAHLSALRGQISDLEGKLAALNTLGNRVRQSANAPENQRHYLLGLDTAGNGKSILAKGNPDTAANVATFIPGTDSNLATVGDQIARSDAMHRAAEKAGSPSTSTITWQGYEAPQGVHNAIWESYADTAAPQLGDFQEGLRASHEGPASHNTVIGHSYGSTVAGYAATPERGHELDADEFVAVGSPGLGVYDASALNIPEDHVWATAAADDPVPDTEVFPVDPTREGFGRVFGSASGTESPHSDYWDRGNPALEGMGRIIAGKQPP